MADAGDFPAGAHAQIHGLAAKPELNDEYCVSKGANPDNAERLLVVTKTGAQLSLRHANLKPAELLPGTRVTMVGLKGAAKYNGQCGEVHSWHGDRWIVDLDVKERKSFKSENLVILPALVNTRKRASTEPVPEAKKVKTSDLKDLEAQDETVIARAIVRCLHEFPVFAQKCICVLAMKSTITVQRELGVHLTDKQNDGLLRRILKPGEKVKGIEELDAEEQCLALAERKARSLAGSVRMDYCDLRGFIKAGMKEPKFNRGQKP